MSISTNIESKEEAYNYINQLVKQIAREELSENNLNITLQNIILLQNVKNKDDVIEELINRIKKKAKERFSQDLFIQHELYPSEVHLPNNNLETSYNFEILKMVRSRMEFFDFATQNQEPKELNKECKCLLI